MTTQATIIEIKDVTPAVTVYLNGEEVGEATQVIVNMSGEYYATEGEYLQDNGEYIPVNGYGVEVK